MQCLGARCMRHTDLQENVSADAGVADAAGHHSYAHQLHVLVKNNQIGRHVKGLFLGIGLDRRVRRPWVALQLEDELLEKEGVM